VFVCVCVCVCVVSTSVSLVMPSFEETNLEGKRICDKHLFISRVTEDSSLRNPKAAPSLLQVPAPRSLHHDLCSLPTHMSALPPLLDCVFTISH
jgi:hypothetical protein